jgi:hypothetical protein
MTSVRIRGLPWFSRYLPYETHAAKSHSVPAIFRLLFGVALPWRRLHGQQNRNAGSSSNPIRTVGVKIESQFTRPFEGAITIGCARWKSSVAPWRFVFQRTLAALHLIQQGIRADSSTPGSVMFQVGETIKRSR